MAESAIEAKLRQMALETALIDYDNCKATVERDRMIMGAAICAFEKSRCHLLQAENELRRLCGLELLRP